jgi:tyrosine-protein kinase Etk/Wzc
MIFVRTAPSPTSLMKSQLGVLGDLGGGALAPSGGELKTEIALLESRALLGEVVDSLRLQYRAGRRHGSLGLDTLRPPPGRFRPRKVRIGELTVRLVDREDAITDLDRRVQVEQVGGEMLAVRVSASDSLLSALIPNLLIARYIERRRVVDRSTNRERVVFLRMQADSVRLALEAATARVRASQERSGVLALEVTAPALEEALQLAETRLSMLRAESEALDSALAGIAGGDERSVVGNPSFVNSQALNQLVVKLAELEVERAQLLGTLQPSAPLVQANDEAIVSLRAQLLPMARTFSLGLSQRIAGESERVTALRRSLDGVPKAGETLQREQAEVEVLGKLLTAVSTQLLDARLLAIDEGGVVRVVDPAVAPRKPSFPSPALTMLVGVLLGLGVGAFVAIGQPRDRVV